MQFFFLLAAFLLAAILPASLQAATVQETVQENFLKKLFPDLEEDNNAIEVEETGNHLRTQGQSATQGYLVQSEYKAQDCDKSRLSLRKWVFV